MLKHLLLCIIGITYAHTQESYYQALQERSNKYKNTLAGNETQPYTSDILEFYLQKSNKHLIQHATGKIEQLLDNITFYNIRNDITTPILELAKALITIEETITTIALLFQEDPPLQQSVQDNEIYKTWEKEIDKKSNHLTTKLHHTLQPNQNRLNNLLDSITSYAHLEPIYQKYKAMKDDLKHAYTYQTSFENRSIYSKLTFQEKIALYATSYSQLTEEFAQEFQILNEDAFCDLLGEDAIDFQAYIHIAKIFRFPNKPDTIYIIPIPNFTTQNRY